MLSAERMERMIDAPTNEEAAKILEECGYGDLSGLSAKDAGAALEAHIAALFDEVEGMVPGGAARAAVPPQVRLPQRQGAHQGTGHGHGLQRDFVAARHGAAAEAARRVL